MFDIAKKTFKWGQHTVTLETGEIARQASGAVLVSMDDTVVLATVVVAKNPKPGQDWFPLTVDYVEKFYAAREYAPIWTQSGKLSARGKSVIARLNAAGADGLDAADYPAPDFAAATSPDALAEAEAAEQTHVAGRVMRT